VDFPKKVRQANHQRRCGSRKENANKPLQLDLQQGFNEKGRDNSAYKQRGERGCCDCGACKMPPAVKGAKLDLKGFAELQFLWHGVFSELPPTVNDSSQAACHDVEDACNPS
jgi:hypothetical protein